MAPEVLRGAYSEKADLWSLGVVAFVLLCGHAPWGVEDEAKRAQLEQGRPALKSSQFEALSPEARDFVLGLLRGEAARPSASEALRHPWLATH